MATTEDVALTLRLPEQMHKDLTKIADREDRSLAWMIRKAIADLIERDA